MAIQAILWFRLEDFRYRRGAPVVGIHVEIAKHLQKHRSEEIIRQGESLFALAVNGIGLVKNHRDPALLIRAREWYLIRIQLGLPDVLDANPGRVACPVS